MSVNIPLLVYVEGVSFDLSVQTKSILINWVVLVTIFVYGGITYSFIWLIKPDRVVG